MAESNGEASSTEEADQLTRSTKKVKGVTTHQHQMEDTELDLSRAPSLELEPLKRSPQSRLSYSVMVQQNIPNLNCSSRVFLETDD